MSTTFAIKRGDTFPSLQLIVRPASGSTLPVLTSATAVLLTRPTGTTETATERTGAVTIGGTTSRSTFTYAWAAGDTDTIADLDGEFEVTLSGGAVWTVPGVSGGVAQFMRIKIVEDLGDVTPDPGP